MWYCETRLDTQSQGQCPPARHAVHSGYLRQLRSDGLIFEAAALFSRDAKSNPGAGDDCWFASLSASLASGVLPTSRDRPIPPPAHLTRCGGVVFYRLRPHDATCLVRVAIQLDEGVAVSEGAVTTHANISKVPNLEVILDYRASGL